MYKQNKMIKTSIKRNTAYPGDSMITRMQRVLSNKEPISDATPIIYTERKDGVLPDYDIRTDKMEYAVDAMGAASKSKLAKRMDSIKQREEAAKPKPKSETGGQSIDGTQAGT